MATARNTGISGGLILPQSSLTQYGTSGIRQDSGLPYTMVNGVPNTNMDAPGTFGTSTKAPAPAPVQQQTYFGSRTAAAPSTPSTAGLTAAAGAKVPVPEPPVTSGLGDGGVPMLDSGIDRILGAAGGGMESFSGLLRAGLGQRSRPQDSYVLAGRKVY